MRVAFLQMIYNVFQRLARALEAYPVTAGVAFLAWIWGLILATIAMVVLVTASIESSNTEFARWVVIIFCGYHLLCIAVLAQFSPKD